MPDSNSEDVMHFFEMSLHDHLAAAVWNVSENRTKNAFLERTVHYNKLTSESVELLESLARDRSDELQHEMTSEALRRQDKDRQRDHAGKRFASASFSVAKMKKSRTDSANHKACPQTHRRGLSPSWRPIVR